MPSPTTLSELTGISHLALAVISHGSDYLVSIDELFKFMKSHSRDRDRLQAPRRNNMQTEVRRYRNGIIEKDNQVFLTIGAVLRYCFCHSDHFLVCQKIMDETTNELTKGRTSVENVTENKGGANSSCQELAITDELIGVDDDVTGSAHDRDNKSGTHVDLYVSINDHARNGRLSKLLTMWSNIH